MVTDDALARESYIFFEGGDHRSLVHMEQAEFYHLTEEPRHRNFTIPIALLE